MNVAIIQDKIIYGGRLDLLVHVIRFFNTKNIIPTILTYSIHDITIEGIKKRYNIDVLYKIRLIRQKKNLTQDLSIIKFNINIGKYLRDYDLVINSSNTSFGISTKTRMIDYVHFPREFRAFDKRISIHDWSEAKRIPGSRSYRINILVKNLYHLRRRVKKNIQLIGNSHFTKDHIKSIFPKDFIDVLYPPIRIKESPILLGDVNKVATLGRFSVAKNQLQQIRMAIDMPDIKIYIIGFSTPENPYLISCKDEIIRNNLKNVKLCINVSNEERNEILKNCGIFIHTTRNEPFGLSVAQAISFGCVPLIPEDGGAIEIVKDSTLLYSNLAELIPKIGELSESRLRLELIYKSICQNLKDFSVEIFDSKLEQIVYAQ